MLSNTENVHHIDVHIKLFGALKNTPISTDITFWLISNPFQVSETLDFWINIFYSWVCFVFLTLMNLSAVFGVFPSFPYPTHLKFLFWCFSYRGGFSGLNKAHLMVLATLFELIDGQPGWPLQCNGWIVCLVWPSRPPDITGGRSV